jgi:RNA polymerase sigma-70 factor (ECF subfamily)
VLAAGRHVSPDSRRALATLCETYWYPLYAYARRRGHRAEDAEDLIQAFFTELLQKDALQVVDRGRGRFRSFLLAAFNHFAANERRRAGAAKRGGGKSPIPLDVQAGEARYRREPWHDVTPETVYERRWALTLLEGAVAKLRGELGAAGKLDLYEHLKAYLGGDRDAVPYREVAARLGLTEGAVKVAVHRLRRRCRAILRAEIAQTVAGPEEIDEELRDLFRAIGS